MRASLALAGAIRQKIVVVMMALRIIVVLISVIVVALHKVLCLGRRQ